MSAYFIVTVYMNKTTDRSPYDSYIEQVKPIVERFGGEYLVRTEEIAAFPSEGKPDRIIIIRFPSREKLNECFACAEYRRIMTLRTDTVDANSFIAEGL